MQSFKSSSIYILENWNGVSLYMPLLFGRQGNTAAACEPDKLKQGAACEAEIIKTTSDMEDK
jgi:hypothetical protein